MDDKNFQQMVGNASLLNFDLIFNDIFGIYPVFTYTFSGFNT